MIRQFTKYGYSCSAASTAIGTSYSVIAVTGLAANKKSANVPSDCFLESVEIDLSSIAASDSITLFLARDSNGDVPLTSDALSGASQTVTIGKTSSTKGGVIFTVNKDFHFDSTTSNASDGTLYVVAKANAACTADAIRLNWRS